MKKNNIFSFLLMHAVFLLYSFYTVIGKFAAKYDFLSLHFCLFYCLLIFILFLYAIIWQQVLKVIPLSFATANKAATIVWGMLWSFLFFQENISLKKIIGAIIIFIGILILSTTSESGEQNNEQ